MNRQDRAKLFSPFEALGGLKNALAQKECEHEEKVILSAKGERYDDLECEESCGHAVLPKGRGKGSFK